MSLRPLLAGCLLLLGVAPLRAQSLGASGPAAPADSVAAMRPDTGVVRTGPVVPRRREELPYAVGVISGEEIRRSSAISIPDLLDGRVPGVFSLSQGAHNDLRRSIRVRGPIGFSVCTTCGPKILVDGVEINASAVEAISAQGLERIEVIRGPQASLLYGSGAAAGVIHLITAKAAAEPGTHLSLSATLGTVRSEYLDDTPLTEFYDATLAGRFEAGGFSVGAQRSRPAGYVPSYEREAVAASAGFSSQVADLRFGAFSRVLERRFSVPGWGATLYDIYSDGLLPEWGEIDVDDYAEQRNLTVGVSVAYQPTEWAQATLSVGNDIFEHDDREMPTLAAGDSITNVYTERYSFPNLRLGSSIELLQRGHLALSLGLGGDWGRRRSLRYDSYHRITDQPRVRHWQGEILEENYSRGGAFGELQLSLQRRLYASFGLRADYHSAVGSGADPWSTHPQVGLSLLGRFSDDWTVRPRAAWGRGLTPPTMEMAYGDGGQLQPNPDLERQSTQGWEVGVDITGLGGRLTAEATLFDHSTTGALTYADIPAGSDRHYINGGEIRNTGQELALRWSDAPLEVSAALSGLRNEIVSLPPYNVLPDRSGVPVAMDPVPQLLGTVQARYSLAGWLGRDVVVHARATHVGKRWAYDMREHFEEQRAGTFLGDEFYSRWFDGFSRADVGVDVRPVRMLRARVEIRNLLDSSQQELPDHVLPGRQVLLTVGVDR